MQMVTFGESDNNAVFNFEIYYITGCTRTPGGSGSVVVPKRQSITTVHSGSSCFGRYTVSLDVKVKVNTRY